MALKKEIQLENGIILKYHRIASINKITNNQIIIEIASYINEEQRQRELNYYDNSNDIKDMNVFIETIYINIPYEENGNIEDYYDYLKTTEMFKNAQNI